MPSYALVLGDDEIIIARTLEAAKSVGIECRRVQSAKEAFEKAASDPPAVIILDLQSQTYRPLSFLKRLKDRSHPAHSCPVVGYVSHAQTELKTIAHDLGCDFVYPRMSLSHQLDSIFRTLMGNGKSPN